MDDEATVGATIGLAQPGRVKPVIAIKETSRLADILAGLLWGQTGLVMFGWVKTDSLEITPTPVISVGRRRDEAGNFAARKE
jgi:hypothetical protein